MKPKLVRINCTNYDTVEWSKWEIMANELRDTYGPGTKLGDTSILGLGLFLENSDIIITRQLNDIKRRKAKK